MGKSLKTGKLSFSGFPKLHETSTSGNGKGKRYIPKGIYTFPFLSRFPKSATPTPMKEQSLSQLSQISDFDWEELERRLGEVKTESGMEDLKPIGKAIHKLLAWVVSGQLRQGDAGARRVARRMIALAWVIDPELFGTQTSLADLARHLGIHKMLLSNHASEFSARFHVHNKQQLTFNR